MKNFDTFLELAENRYSVRSYEDRQIEPEMVQRMLRAAQVSPTAHNNQPQRIYVLQSEEAIAKIRSLSHYTFNAPTVFMVCADLDAAWHGRDSHNSGQVDAAIAATHMMMTACDEGLGTCWVRGFDKDEIARAFGLPEHYEVVCLLLAGYPSEKAAPLKGWHDKRKSLEEFTQIL